MGDVSTVTTAVSAYQRLGALDFLILLLAIGFCVLVYNLLKSQANLLVTQNKLLDRINETSTILTAHDRQAQEMSEKLDNNMDCLGHMKTTLARVEGRLSK